jgi:hypothetical protein
MTAHGKRGRKNQPVFSCAVTISVKFRDPANKITGKIKRPSETS